MNEPAPKQREEREEEARIADGWQPIETAPKDGTPILVWDESMGYYNAHSHGQDDRRYAIGYWRTKSGKGWGNRNTSRPEPTHWQPLPDPPGEEP